LTIVPAAAAPLDGPAEATSVVITPMDTLVMNNASTRPLIALGQLAHPLKVRRVLDVQIVLGRAAGHQRKYDLDEQHRL
jgi:hypothetical protein